MEKILFVNSCVRKNSRTLVLAKTVLGKLGGVYDEVNLLHEGLKPLTDESLEKRELFVSKGDFSDDMFGQAKNFADADIIVIAAPYWDLSFPSLLKVYLEHITVCGITFEYKKGVPYGLCKAKRLIYVTTAGGKIFFDFGFEYIKTLAEKFFSISDNICFKAEELDIRGADTERIMADAAEYTEKTLNG